MAQDINKVPIENGDLQGAEDLLEDAVELLSTGGVPPSGLPSQEDLVVNMGQGQVHPHMWLVTGSKEPHEYMLRGRLSRQEVDDILEIMADENEMYWGDTDIEGLIAVKFNASAGIDGRARGEFINVSRGSLLNAAQNMMGRLRNGMGRQFRNGNNPSPGPQ